MSSKVHETSFKIFINTNFSGGEPPDPGVVTPSKLDVKSAPGTDIALFEPSIHK